MKKYHGKNPDLRRCYAKKLTLEDGYRIRRFTADDLTEMLHISRQHAYRLINNPEKLQPAQRELLIYKLMGQIPSWGPGWYIEDNGLRAPNGYLFSPVDLENHSMMRQLLRLATADRDRAQERAEALEQRVEWLKKRLETPPELRGRYEQPRVVQWNKVVKKA